MALTQDIILAEADLSALFGFGDAECRQSQFDFCGKPGSGVQYGGDINPDTGSHNRQRSKRSRVCIVFLPNSTAEHLLRPLSRFMKQNTSPEMCKKCAQCCKNFPFVEVSPQEINDLELESALHADLFTHAKGAVIDGFFLQFKKNGDCFFLDEKNGDFFCAVYTARPGICQKYPSLPLEKATCRHHRQKQFP